MPDLTTLADLKSWLAIPVTQTGSDAALTSLVSATSEDFLRAIERTDLLTANYTEVREGDGGPRLALRHWPITAVTSLTIANAVVTASADQIAPGWYFDQTLDPEHQNQLYLAGLDFTDGAVISLSYAAGYLVPPLDIAQAVIEWAADRFKGRPGALISSQREAGGEHVAYDKEGPMPATTEAVADRYRRTWPSLDKRQDDLDYRVTRITIGKRSTTTRREND